MRTTSSTRRALGVLAASTLGLSTAVLGVAGAASAATAPAALTFDTAAGDTSVTVPAGYCGLHLTLTGGSGAAGAIAAGTAQPGGLLDVVLPVDADEVFHLYPGLAGGAASSSAAGLGGLNADPADTDGYDDGGDGDLDDTSSTYTSGGGAASTITDAAGDTVASAFGGDSGDAADSNLGYGGGGGENYAATDPATYDATAAATGLGNGSISGSGVLCDTPAAPTGVTATADGHTVSVAFTPPAWADDSTGDPDAWEVRVDGGTWTSLTVESDYGTDGLSGVVGDLAVGSHTVEVRGTNEAGNGTASAAATVDSYDPLGAPTNLVVTPSASALTITWSDPTVAGTYDLGGFAAGWGQGERGDEACVVAATVHTCTFGVGVGSGYTVRVYSVDAEGHSGGYAEATDVVVPGLPAPTALPTQDDGDLTGPTGPISAVTAGSSVTLQGAGFLPGSDVDLYAFSTPVKLGVATVLNDGTFSAEVTLPAGLSNGVHHLVAQGVDPAGNVRTLVITVTVSGGTAAEATLAYTGASPVGPLVGGGLALLAGSGLLVAARRRRTTV